MAETIIAYKFRDEILSGVTRVCIQAFEDIIPVYIGSFKFYRTESTSLGFFIPPMLRAFYTSEKHDKQIRLTWQHEYQFVICLEIFEEGKKSIKSYLTLTDIDESNPQKTFVAICIKCFANNAKIKSEEV
mgnify:CR=1 FL=1